MALVDLFKRRTARGRTDTAPLAPSYVRSPFSTVTPDELVFADLFGDKTQTTQTPVKRAEAMRVPAVASARNRLIEGLAGRPLCSYIEEEPAAQQPAWMTRTDNPLSMSPHQRMVETLDDLIFDGMSLWAVNRGADGRIIEALHVPREWWSLDPDGSVRFDGELAPADQVVLIPGPHRGILKEAPDLIRAGLDLERAWRSRARNPLPTIILKEREDNGMDMEEARAYVQAIAQARRNPDGAVMFVPYKIDVEIPNVGGTDFLETARNQLRIDIAGYFNLTAQAVEASKNQSTLTYETTAGVERQTADRISFWSEPIEARLGMDDVVPRGHSVRFDFTDRNNAATGTPTED